MDKVKRFLVKYPFIVIPAIYIFATVLMDIAMYLFMGLRFPSRYYFSLTVLLSICGLLFFFRKPSIQYGICIFLLAVHFAVAVANIILFEKAREIVSLESLSATRQVATLTDFIVLKFSYMFTFSIILLTFICAGIWMFSVIGRNRKRYASFSAHKYRRNLVVAVATLSITAYLTGFFHSFSLPKVDLDISQAYSNYTNDRFVYSTFSNRLRVLQEFGTYSYYWSNLSFIIGFKQTFYYNIPNEVTDNFTFESLAPGEQNLIMLQMETLENNLVNPLVMPNLWNFLYNDGVDGRDINNAYKLDSPGKTTAHNTVKFQGYYSVDRTSIAEYATLAGTHLDGVEMNTMPKTLSPFSLPNILKNTNHQNADTNEHYTSIKAFHNYYSFMYGRDRFFTDGLGFDQFVPLVTNPSDPDDMVKTDYKIINGERVEVYGPAPNDPKNETRHDNRFNRNSDYKMFLSQVEKMAPLGEKFFSWILNISTHMPYYDSDLFEFYEESGHSLFCDTCSAGGYNVNCNNESYTGGYIEELRLLYENLNSNSQRTQNAVKSYLSGAYEYDRGLGVLFDHLRDNDLLDKTTIVFYADHYNNTATDLLAPTASAKHDVFNPVAGGLQGKMLAFYIYSPVFESASKTEKHIIKDGFGENSNFVRDYDNIYFNKRLGNPNDEEHGILTKFVTHFDVYSTVCDLFHVKTSSRFTLGISAFQTRENVGFSVATGLIFNDKWATNALSNFNSGLYTGTKPTKDEIDVAKTRLSYMLAVKNNLRPLYRSDTLRNDQNTYYYISS